MEFQEVCKNFTRMCDSIGCSECGIEKAQKIRREFPSCESFLVDCPEKSESIVEQWAKEHPIVTNGDKFREVFGIELKSSERYDGYCLLTGNDSIAKDSEEWLNQEYKEPEVEE